MLLDCSVCINLHYTYKVLSENKYVILIALGIGLLKVPSKLLYNHNYIVECHR